MGDYCQAQTDALTRSQRGDSISSRPSRPSLHPHRPASLPPSFSSSRSKRAMGDSAPQKSRILAALDLTEDDPSPSSPVSAAQLLLSRSAQLQAGEKRKRGAEYAGAVATPLNKRQVNGTSRALVNRLPSGLLASTKSPGV